MKAESGSICRCGHPYAAHAAGKTCNSPSWPTSASLPCACERFIEPRESAEGDAQKMAREVQRPQIVELRAALRRAIEVARFAVKHNYDTDRDAQNDLDELAALEKML